MVTPGKYKTAGITMLAAGIFNILWSLVLAIIIFLYASMAAVATLGLGCVFYGCLIWPLLPFAMGIVELIVSIQMLNGKPVNAARTTSIAGVVVAVLNMAMIPLVLEIVTMISLNDEEVAEWMRLADQGEIVV